METPRRRIVIDDGSLSQDTLSRDAEAKMVRAGSTTMDETQEDYVSWKGWQEDDFGRFDSRHRRYFDWHVNRALRGKTTALVLEIGFGNGAFLGYCKQRGCSAWGIELDPRLRERASRAGFPTRPSLDELPTGQHFDLIVLFDVLEHVPTDELIPFVKKLRERLTRDGAVLLRVPNGDSPFGRRNQHGDLTHVAAFAEFKLKQLAQLCDLKLVELGEAPWHSQRFESRNLRCLTRAVARSLINRIFGFAYFNRAVDLDTNLAAVLVPTSSPRPAFP